MTIARSSVWLMLVTLLLSAGAGAGVAAAQAPRDGAPAAAAGAEVTTIANGWAALAAGRRDEAIKAAETILTRRPADHRAVDLKIETLAGREPLQALDAYETWLARTRGEDVFLLVPVARGTLALIGAGQDRALALRALQKLARSGDPQDVARLQALEKEGAAGGTQTDVMLALDGDAAAAQRLSSSKASASVQPQTLAKALGAGGTGVAPTLRAMLKHPAAPVRMEAALSLGRTGAADAIPDLKAMMNDPEVRAYAAVALVQLGDSDAQPIVQELLQSPVLDMRVLGAQAYAGKGGGPWVQALLPALQDPNGLTRIRAAELLMPVAPESAMPVLLEAAKDSNPVVRADVTRVLDQSAATAEASAQAPAADAGPGRRRQRPRSGSRRCGGSSATRTPRRGCTPPAPSSPQPAGGAESQSAHFCFTGIACPFTLLQPFPRADNAVDGRNQLLSNHELRRSAPV